MSKHPLDHGHAQNGERLERYIEIERAEKPSKASETLQKRPQESGATRVEKYTEIERRGAE